VIEERFIERINARVPIQVSNRPLTGAKHPRRRRAILRTDEMPTQMG
jgi:hypothetical protein